MVFCKSYISVLLLLLIPLIGWYIWKLRKNRQVFRYPLRRHLMLRKQHLKGTLKTSAFCIASCSYRATYCCSCKASVY